MDKYNIAYLVEAFANDLLRISGANPKDFNLHIGMSEMLVDKFSDDISELYESCSSLAHNKNTLNTKIRKWNSLTTGNVEISIIK